MSAVTSFQLYVTLAWHINFRNNYWPQYLPRKTNPSLTDLKGSLETCLPRGGALSVGQSSALAQFPQSLNRHWLKPLSLGNAAWLSAHLAFSGGNCSNSLAQHLRARTCVCYSLETGLLHLLCMAVRGCLELSPRR